VIEPTARVLAAARNRRLLVIHVGAALSTLLPVGTDIKEKYKMSHAIVYRSQVRIERDKGPSWRAYLPAESRSIRFGVHAEIAEHYGVNLEQHEPHAATLDYLTAAVAGCLTKTFGSALEARAIPAGKGYLTAEAVGEVEEVDKVLVLRRIHVTYHLKLAVEKRDVAERVHAFHAKFCPVYRSIGGSITITTSLEMEDAL
jgi:uncharacterized OsmC-like protein